VCAHPLPRGPSTAAILFLKDHSMNRIIRRGAVLFPLLIIAGCGPKAVPVEGVVKFDGAPVEGATVTFVTSDGKQSASGQTDASGHFSLSTSTVPGAYPGDYKVVVVKNTQVAGNETMTADSPEYMKHMKKEAAEQGAMKGGNAADMMKMKMMGKGGGTTTGPVGPKQKSLLPAIYASVETTPLNAKVPPDSQPIQIDLKK
jgi:hypothetical protein